MAAVDQSAFFAMGDHTLKVPMELFAQNRRRLAERLREKAPHSIVVLQGGSDSHHYCSDVDYKFQQSADDVEEEHYDDGDEWSAIHKVDETVERDELSNQPIEFQFLNSNSKSVNDNAKRSVARRKQLQSRKSSNVIIETDDTTSEPYVLPEQLFLQQASAAETFDTCSMYCQLLAEKLRSLSSRNRIIVQNKIDNLMFDALMEEMGMGAPSASSQRKPSSTSTKEGDVEDNCRNETNEITDFDANEIVINSSINVVSNMEDRIVSNLPTRTHDNDQSDIMGGEY